MLVLILGIISWPVWATTYYACIAGDINAANAWEDAVGCDGTTFTIGTGGFPASGSVLEANGQAMVINTDPGPNGTVTLNTAAGGGFAMTAAAAYGTIHANIGVVGNTGTTDVVTLGTGTNVISAGILGNIYGGGTANADGLVIAGSAVTYTIGAAGSPVTIVGGTLSTTLGVNDGHTTTTGVVYANSTGGTAAGYKLASTGSVTYTGNCTGSATTTSGVGCSATSSGVMTATGNMIMGDGAQNSAPPYFGNVIWTPAAPADGVNGNYFLHKVGTDVYFGTAPAGNTATNVKPDSYFVNSTNGTTTEGTASTGGGAYAY